MAWALIDHTRPGLKKVYMGRNTDDIADVYRAYARWLKAGPHRADYPQSEAQLARELQRDEDLEIVDVTSISLP